MMHPFLAIIGITVLVLFILIPTMMFFQILRIELKEFLYCLSICLIALILFASALLLTNYGIYGKI